MRLLLLGLICGYGVVLITDGVLNQNNSLVQHGVLAIGISIGGMK